MVGIEDVDLDILGSIQGYILEEKKLSDQVGLAPNATVKRAPNGTVLIPQPSEDPEDPLNWSDWKKAGILLVVVANSFPRRLFCCHWCERYHISSAAVAYFT